MRYLDPTLQDLLAAEYVMGNLRGQARRRFEKLMIQFPQIQYCVTDWADRLHPLNEDIDPVTPPEIVWNKIQANIQIPKPRIWSNLVFWRSFGMVAASLTLVVTLLFSFSGEPTQHVAFVINKHSQPVWVVQASAQSRRVKIKTLVNTKMPEDKVCVLWLVWQDGKTQSVGVLSDNIGKAEMMLPKDMTRKPEMADVAVSIETMGDKMDKPRGKIVFKGPWVEL